MLNRWLENETKLTAVFAVISGIALIFSLTGVLEGILPFDIAWIAIILCGVPILTGAVRGLIFDHDIKADVLVSMALVASVATGEYFAAGEVALIMQIGSLLEDYTSGKAKESIERLISLTPQKAHVIRDGKEITIPAEEVKKGDTIRVLAGETIPVDGVILEGQTTIDQSVMTGESMPEDKGEKDEVFSGTVNQYGIFTMRAEKKSGDSSLQRMIKLAREAEKNQAPVVCVADRWAGWLVLVALACAVLTWIFTGEFMRAVTVLVVFCPCAFILAAPTAVLAGIGNAAKYGIIIRSGSSLEKLSKIKRAAFDKTGTLTYGKPEVSFMYAGKGCTEEEILVLTAAVEKYSEHPLGKAVVKSCKSRTEGWDIPDAFNVRVIPGQGIEGFVNGKDILVGKKKLMMERGIDLSYFEEKSEECLAGGAALIYTAVENEAAGIIALSDQIRKDTQKTIAKLRDEGVIPMLLTGDHAASAGAIAKKAGITDVRADLLPEEKMDIIRSYKDSDEPICMIGDGVNDALALAAANAGIAMGGIGSDIAIESSDAVLAGDDIRRIPYLLLLTKKVMSRIRVNITASMIINITAIVLSALGILTPITGALWHNCGSVFVVVNAALLLRFKDTDDEKEKEAAGGKEYHPERRVPVKEKA